MSSIDLTGKTILITGAGGGIGRATARAVGRAGARVVAIDRDPAAVEETVAVLGGDGVEAIAVVADVTDPEDVDAYVSAAVSRFGRIDGFFNNAGIEGQVTPIAELDPEAFDRVIAVNVRGVFLGLRAVIRQLIAQGGGGAIVCTGSLASERGLPLTGAYNASKHAVLGLVRTAAAEAGAHDIRVNAVLPGMIDTRMLHSLSERLVPGVDTEESVAGVGATVAALARTGKPEEVADVVAFLLSNSARYVTGAGLPVDGGALAIMGNTR